MSLHNAQFVIDEAYNTGAIGPKGAGLVNALGLEKDVAIRLHTFGKALAASDAVVLCNNIVRTMLLNHSRSIMYSVAPSFLALAAARASYTLLKTGKTQQAQERVQYLVKLFMKTLTSSPIWDRAFDAGLLHIPLYDDEDIESLPFVTQILPIWTRPKHALYLSFHLQLAKFFVLFKVLSFTT
ncbi:hypothetical protein G7Y89_g4099 [Cudoniella acicularis]|uniref:Aminotransferase class I/classII large domain-containing protein n=1 Tax=Cudoniella acicularis TaxID=354080 RepID=A0A8H4W7S0_9HELO|nr:hypothetical protein G7Y89_g4099 [Cudoniella acicularis]